MLECVVNVSEGRDQRVLDRLATVAGDALLDVHRDPHHNRAVFTLVGEDAPRQLTNEAVGLLDLGGHAGVHPRIGVVDVVPFVPLGSSSMVDAVAARDRFAAWAADTLGLPCFCYGEERSLPEVRRRAFTDLLPDTGPSTPHPTAGACAVGARGILIAYNVWVTGIPLATVRRVATSVRTPGLRTLGLEVGTRLQVSCNLITPELLGPDHAFDRISAAVQAEGGATVGTELVGLVPGAVLERIDRTRWDQLDLAVDRTIEHRLDRRG